LDKKLYSKRGYLSEVFLMLKKLLLLLCLSCLVAWAAPSKARKATMKCKSKKATTAVVEQTVETPADAPAETDDGFMSVSESSSSAAKASADDDDEEENVEASTAGMTAAQRQDYFTRKKFEEEQRLDEYANSERRRDWLKDRLVFEMGLGSRMPVMCETGVGFGIGAEYITRWHVGLFASYGFLPKVKDNEFDYMKLEGGTGYKVGINYYFFPKIPIHLGLSASYGTVYYDHDMEPDANNLRSLISVKGYQFDVLISYLSNEWYYLQFSFGMNYAPDLGKAPEKNPSFKKTVDSRTEAVDTYASRVVNKPNGMDKTGIVFGVTIGYALPEFFPDDTEKRRRQREKERERNSRR
jgi:glucan-binding YG repeat protein